MKYLLTFVLIGIVATIVIPFLPKEQRRQSVSQNASILLPLGDSYTIGEGATPETSWPAMLTKELQQEGHNIVLAENPAVTGYTTQDLISRELGLLDSVHPTHVTVMIGVNDWVRGVPEDTFRTNIAFILDTIQKTVRADHITLITIPNFSVFPTGAQYSGGRDIASGLQRFNNILVQEAESRSIAVVDVFDISTELAKNQAMIADDGLHPSAAHYAQWARLISKTIRTQLPEASEKSDD